MRSVRTTWWRPLVRCAGLMTVLAAGAAIGVGTAAAQQLRTADPRRADAPERPHIAPRTGLNFDSKDLLVGVQFIAPINNRFEFYPSTDVYFPDRGSQLAFNGDVRYRMPTGRNLAVYGGTGLNVMNRQVGGTSRTNAGMNLLGGLEARSGWVHPFLEGKVTLRDDSFFQAATGVSITLGRP